jgi:hypothetical protein
VPAICREIIAEFTKAGLQTPAVEALALLQEALALGNVSPVVIREAWVSLTRHSAERPRVFAAGGGGDHSPNKSAPKFHPRPVARSALCDT